MGSNANRLRRKWQDYSGKNAGKAEKIFHETFLFLFENTEYLITKNPKDFKTIYINQPISERDNAEIYKPDVEITKHGVSPDFSITNTETNKTIYIEIKRQDGWVENKPPKAGRGNAHERSCKYFTPGLLKILRTKGNLGEDVLPFWTVFQGDITRDPKRVREITCWYDGLDAHFFFWRDASNSESLVNHFIERIKPILD